ncbi:hypothetical protein EPN54_01775 [bacterium]|nr:MAG: hypothetical protein EPN54_01775 [bacterium]
MLEADLQLKKDTASFTSPQTAEGKEYWNRLYKKASELYGSENITIPTLTRPWIVPNEIIVRETKDSAYIYKATLKVMLEQDYLKGSTTYSFKDSRSKALNEYSSQLIRELIIPKLTKEVNLSKKYAPLRQVYYSLILSRWFKSRFYGQSGTYPSLIDKNDLTNLTSKTTWDKSTYFNEYKKSFAQGEYNIKEPVYTPTGQTIRSYFSGGIQINPPNVTPSGFTGASPVLSKAIEKTLTPVLGNPQGDLEIGRQISASPVKNRAQGKDAYDSQLENIELYISLTKGDIARLHSAISDHNTRRINNNEVISGLSKDSNESIIFHMANEVWGERISKLQTEIDRLTKRLEGLKELREKIRQKKQSVTINTLEKNGAASPVKLVGFEDFRPSLTDFSHVEYFLSLNNGTAQNYFLNLFTYEPTKQTFLVAIPVRNEGEVDKYHYAYIGTNLWLPQIQNSKSSLSEMIYDNANTPKTESTMNDLVVAALKRYKPDPRKNIIQHLPESIRFERVKNGMIRVKIADEFAEASGSAASPISIEGFGNLLSNALEDRGFYTGTIEQYLKSQPQEKQAIKQPITVNGYAYRLDIEKIPGSHGYKVSLIRVDNSYTLVDITIGWMRKININFITHGPGDIQRVIERRLQEISVDDLSDQIMHALIGKSTQEVEKTPQGLITIIEARVGANTSLSRIEEQALHWLRNLDSQGVSVWEIRRDLKLLIGFSDNYEKVTHYGSRLVTLKKIALELPYISISNIESVRTFLDSIFNDRNYLVNNASMQKELKNLASVFETAIKRFDSSISKVTKSASPAKTSSAVTLDRIVTNALSTLETYVYKVNSRDYPVINPGTTFKFMTELPYRVNALRESLMLVDAAVSDTAALNKLRNKIQLNSGDWAEFSSSRNNPQAVASLKIKFLKDWLKTEEQIWEKTKQEKQKNDPEHYLAYSRLTDEIIVGIRHMAESINEADPATKPTGPEAAGSAVQAQKERALADYFLVNERWGAFTSDFYRKMDQTGDPILRGLQVKRSLRGFIKGTLERGIFEKELPVSDLIIFLKVLKHFGNIVQPNELKFTAFLSHILSPYERGFNEVLQEASDETIKELREKDPTLGISDQVIRSVVGEARIFLEDKIRPEVEGYKINTKSSERFEEVYAEAVKKLGIICDYIITNYIDKLDTQSAASPVMSVEFMVIAFSDLMSRPFSAKDYIKSYGEEKKARGLHVPEAPDLETAIKTLDDLGEEGILVKENDNYSVASKGKKEIIFSDLQRIIRVGRKNMANVVFMSEDIEDTQKWWLSLLEKQLNKHMLVLSISENKEIKEKFAEWYGQWVIENPFKGHPNYLVVKSATEEFYNKIVKILDTSSVRAPGAASPVMEQTLNISVTEDFLYGLRGNNTFCHLYLNNKDGEELFGALKEKIKNMPEGPFDNYFVVVSFIPPSGSQKKPTVLPFAIVAQRGEQFDKINLAILSLANRGVDTSFIGEWLNALPAVTGLPVSGVQIHLREGFVASSEDLLLDGTNIEQKAFISPMTGKTTNDYPYIPGNIKIVVKESAVSKPEQRFIAREVTNDMPYDQAYAAIFDRIININHDATLDKETLNFIAGKENNSELLDFVKKLLEDSLKLHNDFEAKGLRYPAHSVYAFLHSLNARIIGIKKRAENIVLEYWDQDDKIVKRIPDNSIYEYLVKGIIDKAKKYVHLAKSDPPSSSPLGGIDTSLRSVSIPDGKMGGIDFKHQAMSSATKYEAMGSFAGLDFSLPKLSSSVLLSFNLDKEQTDISQAIDNGIIVSGQRIKEFMAASANKGELDQRRETVITWLAKLGILEETTCCTQESSKEYREALVIADSAVI